MNSVDKSHKTTHPSCTHWEFSGSSGGRAAPTTIFFSFPFHPTRHSCNCVDRFDQAFENFFFDSSSRWREALFWSDFGNRRSNNHLPEMGLNSFEAKENIGKNRLWNSGNRENHWMEWGREHTNNRG